MACRPELRQVPTEGRSFEEAAQVLQSDLIEKESRHENAQEEVKRLREKNEELLRALRKSEEKSIALLSELDHVRVELRTTRMRLSAVDGANLEERDSAQALSQRSRPSSRSSDMVASTRTREAYQDVTDSEERPAMHRWTLPFLIVGVTFFSYIMVQLRLP